MTDQINKMRAQANHEKCEWEAKKLALQLQMRDVEIGIAYCDSRVRTLDELERALPQLKEHY